jgi:hypothetical protein
MSMFGTAEFDGYVLWAMAAVWSGCVVPHVVLQHYKFVSTHARTHTHNISRSIRTCINKKEADRQSKHNLKK